MGVRTVVNLRARHGGREAVEAEGMRYVEIPMSFLKKVDPAAVRKALSVMTDRANQPVFVHCSVGTDRTGVVVAVYRMEVDGWSEAEAMEEMEALGFHEVWFRLKKTVKEWRSGE
jgi:tyrosine-protein phosphatase SIW14